VVECSSLLSIHLASLHSSRPLRSDPRLPCRRPDILRSVRIGKEFLDFFECLASSLGEHEEHVYKHCQAEYAKYEVGLPFDVYKCGRDEVAERKVECPICRSCERDSFAPNTEGIELGWVDPGDRTPGRGK